MPFQSEAQRRYLWANEPEIARDWTDTYGSRIDAALGGIMASRAGFQFGGHPHSSDSAVGSGQTSGPSGGNDGGGGNRENYIQAQYEKPRVGPKKDPQDYGLQNKNLDRGFLSNLGTSIQNFNPLDYAPFVGKKSLSGMLTRGLTSGIGNLFKGSGWDSSMGPRKDMGYNPNRINPFLKPEGGGDGQQQQYPPWWYDDAYAQNIAGDEELDIDTSTGDMEEWIQRFRVDNPYRQDQGDLDEQIKEYVSNLYQ